MKSDSVMPDILFEDAHLLVLSKPAGLLSQGEKTGDVNLIDLLRKYVGRHYVGLVHRLDRNTSGAMVVAKRSKAAARLTAALQKGQIKRVYSGWCVGKMAKPETWKDWLLKDEGKNKSAVVSSADAGAQKAITHVQPLSHAAWKGLSLTLAEFQLESGRSHQIRVQSAYHGFPLLGDDKYGKYPKGSTAALFARPALHAHKITFPHPMTGESLTFEAPWPEDFKDIKPLSSVSAHP